MQVLLGERCLPVTHPPTERVRECLHLLPAQGLRFPLPIWRCCAVARAVALAGFARVARLLHHQQRYCARQHRIAAQYVAGYRRGLLSKHPVVPFRPCCAQLVKTLGLAQAFGYCADHSIIEAFHADISGAAVRIALVDPISALVIAVESALACC